MPSDYSQDLWTGHYKTSMGSEDMAQGSRTPYVADVRGGETPADPSGRGSDELFDKRTTVEKLEQLQDRFLRMAGNRAQPMHLMTLQGLFERLLHILIAERKGTSRG